ncbi:ROK family transcriptional regulator [Herbidospora mongoliensis]|uniref:ROK family transcriptional regulator n=1 Tax=Herbidospora mongoliensis TaxID=688067 RepID=UPI000AA2DBF2|nr:ROK family transcriptional regulator [Herbidospora mongoliensis]
MHETRDLLDPETRSDSVLQVIRALMCRSGLRTELARRTGLSIASVSTAVQKLLDDGIAHGGKKEPVALLPAQGVAVGIQVGTRQVTVAARLPHWPRDQVRLLPLAQGLRDGGAWIDAAAVAVADLVGSIGRGPGDIATMGLAVPWSVDPRDLTPSPPAPWFAAPDLHRRLSARFGPVKVVVDADARLGALNEQTYHHPFETLLYVEIAEHVLGGLVIGPRMLRGALGRAGSIGHHSVEPVGLDCWCGKRGCLERYISVPAVLEGMYVSTRARGEEPPASIGDLIERARNGDPDCRWALIAAARKLARALRESAVTLETQAVVLGGPLAPGLRLVAADCEQELRRSPWTRHMELRFAQPDAAAHGALILGLIGHLR